MWLGQVSRAHTHTHTHTHIHTHDTHTRTHAHTHTIHTHTHTRTLTHTIHKHDTHAHVLRIASRPRFLSLSSLWSPRATRARLRGDTATLLLRSRHSRARQVVMGHALTCKEQQTHQYLLSEDCACGAHRQMGCKAWTRCLHQSRST